MANKSQGGIKIDLEAKDKILENCRKNVKEKERAIATGIGVFALIVKEGSHGREILLRKRQEKESLYNEDLSGRWELIGGGVDLADLSEDPKDYTVTIENTLKHELKEESGLNLIALPENIFMIPAWLVKDGLIDLAFVTVIEAGEEGCGDCWIEETLEFKNKISSGEVRWFPWQSVEDNLFISPRMAYLTRKAIEAFGEQV